MKLGFGIMLHLDSATHSIVEEFSTSGFLGHKSTAGGHDVLVVPKSGNTIESATRDALVTIAKREGWTIEHTEVNYNPLLYAGSLSI